MPRYNSNVKPPLKPIDTKRIKNAETMLHSPKKDLWTVHKGSYLTKK